MRRVYAIDLGRRPYEEVLKIQEKLEERVREMRGEGYLLISENDPVITVGRSSGAEEVLYSDERLRALGISKYKTERGGRVTLHGPGQIVGYPILNLEGYRKDLHWYLENIEESIGGALESLGVGSHRSKGKTGVWTEKGKICAIGVRVRRWVATHGFALNHNIDLELFSSINPCGLMEYGVTRIEDHREGLNRGEILEAIYESFGERFSCEVVRGEADELL